MGGDVAGPIKLLSDGWTPLKQSPQLLVASWRTARRQGGHETRVFYALD